MMKRILLFFIKGYKRWVSPLLGNNCRFSPTCSEYAMESIEIHGCVKGILLSSWRILRCNPFGKGGYDPPPLRGTWDNPNKKLRKN